MVWAGFVESRRGSKGGFVLLEAASQIRVTDVCAYLAHSPPNEGAADPVLQILAPVITDCGKELQQITIVDLAGLSTPGTGGKDGSEERP